MSISTSKNRLITFTVELTSEQQDALLRVLATRKITVGQYCSEMVVSGLVADDEEYDRATLAELVGLPRDTSRDQIRTFLLRSA